jgi:hypothetical protein
MLHKQHAANTMAQTTILVQAMTATFKFPGNYPAMVCKARLFAESVLVAFRACPSTCLPCSCRSNQAVVIVGVLTVPSRRVFSTARAAVAWPAAKQARWF